MKKICKRHRFFLFHMQEKLV